MTTIDRVGRSGQRGLPLSAALLGLLCALPFAAAWADIPSTIQETGRLFQISGSTPTPLNGSEQLTFRLYPEQGSPASAVLWTETDTVTVADGYFSVELGTQTLLAPILRSSPQLWLGIQINSDVELQPRFVFSSVPYAVLAGDVQGTINPTSIRINGITVIDANGNWTGSPTGLTGPAGPAGPAGAAGASGSPGPIGPMGPAGATGATGASGPAGPAGPAGATGTAGAAGAIGPVGPAGPQGLTFQGTWSGSTTYALDDAVSFNGSSYISTLSGNTAQQPNLNPTSWTVLAQQGAAGPTGQAGTPGTPGTPGTTGPAGPTGATGPAGVPGAIGPIGPAGPTGATGNTGAAGPAGAIGPAGPTGPAGTPGVPGATGPAGPAGTSAGATIAAATLSSCTNATSCSCPAATPVLITGGASCASTDQYLIGSMPTSTSTWSAMCQVFQTGSNVNASTINITCVSGN